MGSGNADKANGGAGPAAAPPRAVLGGGRFIRARLIDPPSPARLRAAAGALAPRHPRRPMKGKVDLC